MEQTLGKRIVANRKLLGMTQDQLAERLGVTAQAVSKWENDQSCPDINILPELADIFGISTDTLLGRSPSQTVHEAEVIEEDHSDNDGLHLHKFGWDISWDNSKKDAVSLAVLVLAVGALYLLSQILSWGLSFWDVLWPTALLVFGLFGLFPKFSFFRFGCTILGGYFLISKLLPLPLEIDGGIIFAVIVLIFGLSLLADALRKSNKAKFNMTYTDKNGKTHRGSTANNYDAGDESFDYSASFAETDQKVFLPCLREGNICTSFGEYTVDLRGVESVADGCTINASCSFGELTLLVPQRYIVKPVSNTAFASFNVTGQAWDPPEGQILLDANVSFGELKIIYI